MKATEWVQEQNRAFPELVTVGATGEVALLANLPDAPMTDTTAFTDLAKLAYAAIAHTVKTLSERKQAFQQIDATTIFPVCQQQLSAVPPQFPPAVVSGLSEATVLINNRLWKESELPDCVTLDIN
jgi:hypothetical protein